MTEMKADPESRMATEHPNPTAQAPPSAVSICCVILRAQGVLAKPKRLPPGENMRSVFSPRGGEDGLLIADTRQRLLSSGPPESVSELRLITVR
jgi:hypothetical protein